MALFTNLRPPAERRTHDAWWDHLKRIDAELTLEEFLALELAYTHAYLDDIHAAMGMHPTRNGGYFEQIRNLHDNTNKWLREIGSVIQRLQVVTRVPAAVRPAPPVSLRRKGG